MTVMLKIRKVGNSLGLIVPKEVARQLRLNEGDCMHATIERGGEVRLTPFDPKFEKALEAFERTRGKYRNAFKRSFIQDTTRPPLTPMVWPVT
jgi:putative addiction module antidote